MSIHVHVYLEDIDTKWTVVLISNAHLCSLARAFATHMYSQPISLCEMCLK